MSKRDLAKDMEICRAATSGPWEWQVDKWHGGYTGLVGPGGLEVLYPNCQNAGDDGEAWFEDFPCDADRNFIAAAREGWPAAIERALKAEKQNEKLLSLLHEDVYPMIYGRTSDLLSAGEENAARRWNELCQKVYQAGEED